MSNNRRFALDEKRHVIDAVNPANSGKGYCHEGDPEDDRHLRERVLMVPLGKMLDKLIINLRPTKKYPSGEEYQPFNEEVTQCGWRCWMRFGHRTWIRSTPSCLSSIGSTARSSARRKECRISRRCRFFATTLSVYCATFMGTSKARRWTAF